MAGTEWRGGNKRRFPRAPVASRLSTSLVGPSATCNRVPSSCLLPAARQLPVIISVLTMRCVSADGRAVSKGNRNRCSALAYTRGIFPTGLPLMISGVGIFQLQSDVDMAVLWVR